MIEFINTTWRIFVENAPLYFYGAWITIYISVIGTVVGAFIGFVVGIIKTVPLPHEKGLKYYTQKLIDMCLTAYVQFFRATPMIVQAMIFYYGTAEAFNIQMDKTVAGLIIVSINTGAYMAEIVRGGIISIDNGQFEAARAIGMNHFKTMYYIVLPQVIRNIIPAIGNEFIINIKDTSVLSVISINELFFTTKSIAGRTFRYFPSYTITCILFLIMTLFITYVLKKVEEKLTGPQNYALVTPTEAVADTSGK